MKKVLLFLLVASVLSFSQSNNKYQIEARNVVQTDSKTYEFDVYINSPKNINLSAYQGAFTFDAKILSNKNITFEYISGTTQLINKPTIYKILIENNKQVLVFASGPSFEQILGEKKMGKFRLKSAGDFVKNKQIKLAWYSTQKISTIIAGTDYNNITNDFIYKVSK